VQEGKEEAEEQLADEVAHKLAGMRVSGVAAAAASNGGVDIAVGASAAEGRAALTEEQVRGWVVKAPHVHTGFFWQYLISSLIDRLPRSIDDPHRPNSWRRCSTTSSSRL